MDDQSTLLPAEWTIPVELRGRLGTSAGRQRLLAEEGHLVLVLHAPPGADEIGRRGRFFWRDPAGNWHAAPNPENIRSIEEHLREYGTVIEELEHAEEAARDGREYFELLDSIAPLTRACRNMHDALQRAREVEQEDKQLIIARDLAYDLLRRIELLYEDTKNGLEFAIAWQAEQQAESSRQMAIAAHRLNMLAAFFLPIATLMAIFGANLTHGLEKWNETAAPLPLITVIAFGLLCGGLLTLFISRSHRGPETKR